MMVAEDVIITEEVLVEVLVAEEVQSQEEKEALLQEKVLVADLEATEVQHQEKVVLEEVISSKRRWFYRRQTKNEGSSDRAPRRSENLVTHQDQEDQEETNI
jgi:hypothetical protein